MFCKQCGKMLPDDAKWCPDCGTAVSAGQAPKETFVPSEPIVVGAETNKMYEVFRRHGKSPLMLISAILIVFELFLGLVRFLDIGYDYASAAIFLRILPTLLLVGAGLGMIYGGSFDVKKPNICNGGFTVLKVFAIFYLVWAIAYISFVPLCGSIEVSSVQYAVDEIANVFSLGNRYTLGWLEYLFEYAQEYALISIFLNMTDFVLVLLSAIFFMKTVTSYAGNLRSGTLRESGGRALAVIWFIRVGLILIQLFVNFAIYERMFDVEDIFYIMLNISTFVVPAILLLQLEGDLKKND